MFAWQLLDKVTRAWYEPATIFDQPRYVCCFIGPAYHWTGSKYVSCKTPEEAESIIARWYKQVTSNQVPS